MGTEKLLELVYLSASTRPFGITELRELLGRSRRSNRALGVTGLLLHADGSFLQVLEGPPETVDGLYERIGRDPRHGHVVRVFRREISDRCFPQWQMGFDEPQDAMRSELLGYTKVLMANGAPLPQRVSDGVRALVAQFAEGRWRQGHNVVPPVSGTSLR